jgi:hypothetical protein
MAQANDSAGTPRYCWSESDGGLNYFTNDYNENDQQQAARRGRQRLQTFQTDPARFFGQNALNLAPLGSSHRSIDYGPVLLLMPFGFHLTMDTLPSGNCGTVAPGPP